MTDLEFLRLNGPQKFLYKLRVFLKNLPKTILNAFKGLFAWFVGIFKGAGAELYDIFDTYRKGDWKTRVSYTVMGFGSCARGQWLRGILFFVFQTLFNCYLFIPFIKSTGDTYLSGLGFVTKLITLGDVPTTKVGRKTVYGDNSFLIMLYGVLTIFLILAFLYTWRMNVKQNKLAQKYLADGKKLKTAKQDLHDMLDTQFHKTLLAVPVLGVTFFTILPIIFMILVAFTNYDNTHQPPGKLFTWVGMANFNTLLTVEENPMTIALKENADGSVSKLSKRHGAVSFQDLMNDGYLPEAIINYIALLGWCPKNSETEFFTLDELKDVFTIDGVSKSPAVFDFEKLLWFNGEYIHKLEANEFERLVKPFITVEIPANINVSKMLNLLRTRISKLSEINDKMAFFITIPEYEKELFLNKKNKISEFDTVKLVLSEAREIIANVDTFDNDNLFAALSPLTEKLGLKTGTIMWCVRIAVSGMTATPGGATEIMEVIGKDESLARIDAALVRL